MKKFYFFTLCLLCTNATQSALQDSLPNYTIYFKEADQIKDIVDEEYDLNIDVGNIIKTILEFMPAPNKGTYQYAKLLLPFLDRRYKPAWGYYIMQEHHKISFLHDDKSEHFYCTTNTKTAFYYKNLYDERMTMPAPDLVPNVAYADRLEDEIDQDREKNPEDTLSFKMIKKPFYYDGKQFKKGTLKVPFCVDKKIFNAIHRCKEACPSSSDFNSKFFVDWVTKTNKDRIIMKLHKENERVMAIKHNEDDNSFEVFVQAKPSELENEKIMIMAPTNVASGFMIRYPINDLISEFSEEVSIVLESHEEGLYEQLLEQEKFLKEEEKKKLEKAQKERDLLMKNIRYGIELGTCFLASCLICLNWRS